MEDVLYNQMVLKMYKKMDRLSFLEWLLEKYRKNADITRNWVDYLKAHGLANSCFLRDPTKERARTVYDVETSWYGGNHPMTFEEHQLIITHQKSLLAAYRKKTLANMTELEIRSEALSINDMFSSDNLNLANSFSKKVFQTSNQCTKDFVDISRSIILSCVENLSRAGLVAPCSFAAIGFGSIARGEATPYSDLEYGFLVKSHERDRYFTMLALESYFRINNLGESPLGGFYVAELRVLDDNGEPLVKDFETGCVEGYRIDGITARSGNIPTGNGLPSGNPLTHTPEGLFRLYKTELLSPPGDKVGDLSHLLSSSVVIYTSNEGGPLHEQFLKAQAEYETKAQRDSFAIRKRLYQITSDIINPKFRFIPEVYQPFSHFSNTNIKVKTDIFRHPTLLATNLRICLNLKSQTPWEAFSDLVTLDLISEETCQFLHIILSISIYIRIMAYLNLSSQAMKVSLYSKVKQGDSARYHVPLNLFVILGYLLVPIKNVIRLFVNRSAHLTYSDSSVAKIVTSVIKDIRVDKQDYMLKAEVLLYAGDEVQAYRSLCQGMGEGALRDFDQCIIHIRNRYNTTKSDPLERKYIEICCFLLKSQECYAEVFKYLSWLALYETGAMNQVLWRHIAVQCHLELKNYETAKTIVDLCINTVKHEFELSQNESLESYISTTLTSHQVLSDYRLMCCEVAYLLFGLLSKALRGLGLLDDTLEARFKAIRVTTELLDWCAQNGKTRDVGKYEYELSVSYSNLSIIYQESNQLEKGIIWQLKALDIMKVIYGDATNNPNISQCYDNISVMYHSLGEYHLALEYDIKALEMRKALYGDTTNHPRIADSYYGIGITYHSIGNYQQAVKYKCNALIMRKALYGDSTNHIDIARSYYNIGVTYYAMGKYQHGLEFHASALAMKIALYGDTINHIDIAKSYESMGAIYQSMGKYRQALQYDIKALKMREALYENTTNSSVMADSYHNIGGTYDSIGEYQLAIEYYTCALAMRKALYGEMTNHIDIANSYNHIGTTLTRVNNYPAALEYLSSALAMFIKCEGRNQLGFIVVLLRIAAVWMGLGDYKRALQFLNLKFTHLSTTDKAKYREAKHHYMIGKCCLKLEKFSQCWESLHTSLCLCQSLPTTYRNRFLLARVHISIGLLLLHYGRVSQSLEHAQICLDIISNVVSFSEAVLSKHVVLKREAHSLTNSLHLIKLVQVEFVSS